MWNNLKMDLYRMVRQKSFYISMTVMLLLYLWLTTAVGLQNNTPFATFHQGKDTLVDFLYYFPKSFYISMTVMLLLYLWLTTAVGLQNNTPFATFHQGKDTLVDFLYYFPKSSFYQIAVLIFLSLFFCEEYASGFVKNIYPMMHRKELLLLERFVFSFITAFIYWAVIIVMVVVENLWQQDSFASFSILQFICYSLMQMLILTVIASFLNMLIHATGSKVLAILVSVGYGSMTVFMLHAGIMSLLKVEYTDYILYAISGQLPYSWDAVFYSRAAMVAITSAILYNIGSYVLLRKKDLK